MLCFKIYVKDFGGNNYTVLFENCLRAKIQRKKAKKPSIPGYFTKHLSTIGSNSKQWAPPGTGDRAPPPSGKQESIKMVSKWEIRQE